MSALLLPTATPAVPGIAADFSNDNPWVYLVKAVLIIVFLLVEPMGLGKLYGNVRNYLMVWPFGYARK